jgi:hypothetical protein
MLTDVANIFIEVDVFYKIYERELIQQLPQVLGSDVPDIKNYSLCPSEVMTIVIAFHLSSYRNFKHFYIYHVSNYWRHYFPGLVSYPRFISLQKYVILPLCAYLNTRLGQPTGIAFIDSTPLIVCHNKRIKSHRVFKKIAKRGKNSVGWFYGFKLHLIINDRGELLAVKLTPGNVDDRGPVPDMTQKLVGKLFGDKGYISQKLFDLLFERALQLITRIKKNMKNKLMPLLDKILLRKRSLIETVNDQLKNISQIEHTRHRSSWGFIVNLIGGLIAYTYHEKKPSLNIDIHDIHQPDDIQDGNALLPMLIM